MGIPNLSLLWRWSKLPLRENTKPVQTETRVNIKPVITSVAKVSSEMLAACLTKVDNLQATGSAQVLTMDLSGFHANRRLCHCPGTNSPLIFTTRLSFPISLVVYTRVVFHSVMCTRCLIFVEDHLAKEPEHGSLASSVASLIYRSNKYLLISA